MDDLITDLKEIARLSELNSDRNSEFCAFLNASSLWSDDGRLDALVHEIVAEVGPAIDCTACGNCCREMCVSVETDDIERLAKRLGITPGQFEERHVAIDEEDGDKIMPETPCPFQGGNLCTVYEDRPAVCREFPHLDKDGFRSRLSGVLGSADVCPIVFNVLEALKRRTCWRPSR